MRRCALLAVLLLAAPTFASEFDYYTNRVLRNAIDDKKFKPIAELTSDMITEFDSALPDANAAFLVVRTNEGRYAKLLVRRARVKVKNDQVPLLQIVQFTTYREGTERAIQATGQGVHLYPGFQFKLDHGQVVPTEIGGDLAVVAMADNPLALSLKPVGKAEMFLVTEPLPGVVPKKAEKLIVGETFETRYFAGQFKLFDDGRRTGELTLAVDDKGEITGSLLSDQSGEKYDLFGKVGQPQHAFKFTVKFPRTEQTFEGHLFTGNAKVLAGESKMQGREAAFYAERIED